MSVFGNYGVGGEFKPKPLGGQGEQQVGGNVVDGTTTRQPDTPTPTTTGGSL
jgi:hypothetical protein